MADSRAHVSATPITDRTIDAAPSVARDRALWFAVFGPPAAWSVDLLASIALHHDYCAALLGGAFVAWSGIGAILTGVGVALLVMSLGGGWVAWRAYRAIGIDTGRGDTDLDRRRFMARAGLITGLLFSYAIVLRIVAVFIVSPNLCRL
ncbi:MAG: hypothetical protein ABI442_20820 [Gemmatimonadaceae bacterium]